MAKKKQLEPLTPPDFKRCQTLKPNGHSFITFGGVPGHVRCTNKPKYLAKENKAGAGGRGRGPAVRYAWCRGQGLNGPGALVGKPASRVALDGSKCIRVAGKKQV